MNHGIGCKGGTVASYMCSALSTVGLTKGFHQCCQVCSDVCHSVVLVATIFFLFL